MPEESRTDEPPTDGRRNEAHPSEESGGSEDSRPGPDAPTCDCKLGRSLAASDLDGLGDQVRRRHDDGASLRDLERFVNESLLDRALQDADADVLGDVGGVYDALSGAGSAGERTAVRRRLERAGVDVEALESAFVSYQTVRTHLRDCLDVDTSRDVELSRADARGTIEWARSRSEQIVERTLERLASTGDLLAGDPEVTQVVRVSCDACGASATLERFLEAGGCDCEAAADDSTAGATAGADAPGADDAVADAAGADDPGADDAGQDGAGSDDAADRDGPA